MTDTGFPPIPPPPPPAFEYCYRHPQVVTGVHCTRCGRPICPDCMTAAPVGYQCPDCVNSARQEFKRGAGKRIGSVGTSPNQALVIINYGGASGQGILDFAHLMQEDFERAYGIPLETEVNII